MITFSRVNEQITQEELIGNRINLNQAFRQFRYTRIFYLTVNKHRALLADVRVKTAKLKREVGILRHPNPDQTVQNRFTVFKGDIELVVADVI